MNKYRLSDEGRPFRYRDRHGERRVILRQLIAARDFADVRAGALGGWVDDAAALSQQGNCWIYDQNSLAFAGARIGGDARITRPCVISHRARVGDNVWLDGDEVSHDADISDNVTIQSSLVQGECRLFGQARILHQSRIVAAIGLTADGGRRLQIYDNALISRSQIVHQAQIYGDAIVVDAFVEHRAEIFDRALLEGNERNSVWVCDCARVYGRARITAGGGEDAIPTLRYDAQVAGDALVEGDCLLKQGVRVVDRARLSGGPILLDDDVLIAGCASVRGNVLIEHHMRVTGQTVVDAAAGDVIHLRGRKVIDGDQRITRTPLPGLR